MILFLCVHKHIIILTTTTNASPSRDTFGYHINPINLLTNQKLRSPNGEIPTVFRPFKKVVTTSTAL